MKYQNLLARTGEVSQDAIHRALEELWTTPVTKKDTFDLPEGTTLDDLYKALRDGNEGTPTLRKQIESSVSRSLAPGATVGDVYQALKDARRDPADLVLEPMAGMEGGGWPRLLTDRDREDYLKANLRDYGKDAGSGEVGRGPGVRDAVGEQPDVQDRVVGEPVNTAEAAPDREPAEAEGRRIGSGLEGAGGLDPSGPGAQATSGGVVPADEEGSERDSPPGMGRVTQGPLMDPSKMRQVSDLREVNTPHRPDTLEETPEEDWDLFPGETLPQAVGRIRYALGLYPTAARFGPGGPHPGLCRGNPEGCEACGFPKGKTDHCHRYEVCGDCLGFGDASCGTALKMERYAEESK